MASSRLSLALAEAALPVLGRVAIFEPPPATDLSDFSTDHVQIISRQAVTHSAFAGFDSQTAAQGEFSAAVVFVPREKALARALIAQATTSCSTGIIIVEGQKTDGIDALFKECRKRVDIQGHVTKSHGRAFWFKSQPAFGDWQAAPRDVDGFTTLPGVFSADGIDPASGLLAQYLPVKPGAIVADLGAGWGYLAYEMLKNPSVQKLHLVENDAIALDCARQNVADTRAQFHWTDATRWQAPEPLDTVLMNPPFHQGRKCTPELGQSFIANAARNLKSSGQLILVANRHLPYEATLDTYFGQCNEVAGSRSFKVLHATRPTRRGR